MTPLAQRMVKLTLGLKRSSIPHLEVHDCLLSTDTKCFEMTEIYVSTVFDEMLRGVVGGRLDPALDEQIFLPAPAAWIEFAPGADKNLLPDIAGLVKSGHVPEWSVELQKTVGRMGALIRPGSTPASYYLTVAGEHGSQIFVAGTAEIQFLSEGRFAHRVLEGFKGDFPSPLLWFLALHVINTPQIFKQEAHAPHAGLRRDLLRAGALTGRQHLQPWVTIKMDVQTPAEIPGGGGRMTGLKALHFCRAHLRFRRGKVEWVRSHWRGSASNGVVAHDYRVSA